MKSLVEAVSNSLEVVEEKKTKKKRKVKEGAKTEKTKKKLTKKEKQLIEFADNTILPEHYKTVWTEDDLNELALWLKKQPIVAIDTETLGLNPHADDIVGISLFAPTQGWYIPIQHKDDIGDADPASVVTPNEDAPVHVLTPKSLLRVGVDYVKCLPRTLIRETLKSLLEDKDRKLILHNAPFDYHILSNWMDIQITPYFDTSVAQGLLDENVSRKLKDLAPMYLKIPADKFNTLFGKITFNKVPILLNPDTRTGSLASYYAIKDAELTYLLYEFQMKHLNKESLTDIKHLMFDIEMPFQQVVINAESRGIYMDEDYMVNTVAKQLHSELEEIRQKIWAYTGVINLNSPQQKAEALYVKLKLPVINKDKPRCTDKKTLKKLKKHHPVAGLLLEFSSKNKLATSFADKLPKMIKNGKIHASINQIGTVTGRLSCKNPNMQQVPSRVGNLIRNAFYAKEGRLLASLDFSQQEIRVLAHVSQDPVLLDIYRSGKDVHSMTGNGIWNAQHPDQEVDYETFEYRRNIYPLFQDKDGNWVEEYFEEEYLDKLLSEGKINHKDNVREEAELGVKYDKFRKMAKTVKSYYTLSVSA